MDRAGDLARDLDGDGCASVTVFLVVAFDGDLVDVVRDLEGAAGASKRLLVGVVVAEFMFG